ncbi:YdcF family protein [Marinicauda sp. Alg238-R41]|uniref:YdcF family protein n=1 Tax=Marinicauda sp. Alg238-R41 TaxID=2993447 RepID=UPI0022E36A7F|nr:YdcF family protein [Marinicauda sp. Alg238-R41]
MLSVLRFVAFVVVVSALVGFALFVRTGMANPPGPPPQADGIVVLTGGEGRVVSAVELLQAGHGSRLLISGANPDVGLDAVREASGATRSLFACCIDVGQEAANTIGNAEEAARWARGNGFSSLIVVTSDYHMPRAMLELHAAMPAVALTPRAVKGPPPWTDARTARRWVVEFFKYAAVYARESVRLRRA